MADTPAPRPSPAPLPPEQAAALRRHPLRREFIARALDSLGLPYRLDKEGDIFTGFSEEQFGGGVSVWLLVVGDNEDIFRIFATNNRTIAQGKWQAALVACNEFHQTSRYGRAYLVFQKPEEPWPEPMLCFDSRIQLQEATTENFLKSFIVSNLEGVRKLFAMAYGEKDLY